MKNGIKTTEFWLSALSIGVNVLFAVQGLLPAELVVKIIGGISGVYTIARTIVKFTATTKDDEFLDKVSQILKDKNITTEK